jgi:hypothetical protein
MEPVFIFLAIIIFAVVRGATRGQRQRPGIDPFDRPHDVTGDTNERVVEAQERALEALRRWEARQGLGGRPDDAARPRFGDHREATRPAPIRRERREAYAEIAQLLEPNRRASRCPRLAVRDPRHALHWPASKAFRWRLGPSCTPSSFALRELADCPSGIPARPFGALAALPPM